MKDQSILPVKFVFVYIKSKRTVRKEPAGHKRQSGIVFFKQPPRVCIFANVVIFNLQKQRTFPLKSKILTVVAVEVFASGEVTGIPNLQSKRKFLKDIQLYLLLFLSSKLLF